MSIPKFQQPAHTREENLATLLTKLGNGLVGERVLKEGITHETLHYLHPSHAQFVLGLLEDDCELERVAHMTPKGLDKYLANEFPGKNAREPFNYFLGTILHTWGYRDLAKRIWEKKESIFIESRRFGVPEKYLREALCIKQHQCQLIIDAMDIGQNPSVDDGEETGGTLRIHELSRMSRRELDVLAEQYRPPRQRDAERQTYRVRGLRGHVE